MDPLNPFLCRLVAARPETLVRPTPGEDRIVARHFAYLVLSQRG